MEPIARRHPAAFPAAVAALLFCALALPMKVRADDASWWQLSEARGDALLHSEWAVLKARMPFDPADPAAVGWASRVISLPWPLAWPPGPQPAVVYYAHPYGLAPGRLADGEFIAAPWARVSLRPGQPAQTAVWVQTIQPLGVQGVRPMTAEALQAVKDSASAPADLAGLTQLPADDSPTARRIRQRYCAWRSANGVVAEALQPRHATFFAWLGCR